MVLYIRRIFVAKGLFFHDVVHLHIPSPQFWRVLANFVLTLFLPFIFSRDVLDKYCARILYEVVSTIASFPRPKSAQNKLRKLRALLCCKPSIIALLLFSVKCFVCYIGLTVEYEGVSFNQPVIYRTADPPTRSECKLMTQKEERQFLVWEAQHCSRIETKPLYKRLIYVPSVRTVDGSEQLCLPKGKGSIRGNVQVVSRAALQNHSYYEHPVSLIKKGCKKVNVDCGFIGHASSGNGTTWINFASQEKTVIIRFLAMHRPGLTSIREAALSVQAGADLMNYTKTALAVEKAMRHSGCFAKRDMVETVKVPYLVVHVVPLILLFFCERICRFYFKYLVDTTKEKDCENALEYQSIAIEGALS